MTSISSNTIIVLGTIVVHILCDLQADKIQTLCKAADVQVDAIWPKLFAKALEGRTVESV